ncbi:hypothetical protein HJTV-2_gp50 [Haloarcula virus HJTV-2]|uniref:Uncharacterized protein n=1 Tax=Haloarcula virus HJTV-2 TaxID=2877986 RepID=A0AAE9BWR3_9CAUD|nr:hypothetical protein M1M33_gp097 [Haloarcula virus HJTV-2]UBF21670.1 hypothetical protein HJTV-2_gp50 [Haloarcula virus HJTV-2]
MLLGSETMYPKKALYPQTYTPAPSCDSESCQDTITLSHTKARFLNVGAGR